MPKLRVVESRICGAGIGFRLVNNGFLGVGLPVVLGAVWMRFAGRKLSGESLMIASSLVGNSLIRIDESSFD